MKILRLFWASLKLHTSILVILYQTNNHIPFSLTQHRRDPDYTSHLKDKSSTVTYLRHVMRTSGHLKSRYKITNIEFGKLTVICIPKESAEWRVMFQNTACFINWCLKRENQAKLKVPILSVFFFYISKYKTNSTFLKWGTFITFATVMSTGSRTAIHLWSSSVSWGSPFSHKEHGRVPLSYVSTSTWKKE